MSQCIKFVPSLCFLLSLFTISLFVQPISVEAQTKVKPGYMVETTANLNIRETPCGRIRFTLKKHTLIYIRSTKPRVCKLNGVTQVFFKISDRIFVASKYLRTVSKVFDFINYEVRVVTGGQNINLRTKPCGPVIGSVPNNIKGIIQPIAAKFYVPERYVCTVNGGRHLFTKVKFENGKVGFVSGMFLRSMKNSDYVNQF